jgi:DNA-binding response OmpR family regulator
VENILIVEDDRILLQTLVDHLGSTGYLVVTAEDGLRGLQEFYHQRPRLIILDTELPGMDGWTVATRIREISDIPLIMMPPEKEQEVLRAFALGADDCVTKPFSMAVMVARVDVLLKRASRDGPDVGDVRINGDLVIDITSRRVTKRGQVVELTPTEFRLLALLARHAGRPLPHEFLLIEVWGPGYEGEVGHIKRYIWSLRKKLEDDPASPSYLLTERGFGYCLDRCARPPGQARSPRGRSISDEYTQT